MAHINDHPINISSDYGNSGLSLLIRTKTYGSSNSNLLVNCHSTPVIINVFDHVINILLI